MTVFEILEFNRDLLIRLRRAGIRLEDADYVDLFTDFRLMTDKGEKVSYAVAVLAERYGVCERKVYSLIRRFRSRCSHDAV